MLHDDEMENEFPTYQDQLDFQNEVKERENDKQPPASHYEDDMSDTEGTAFEKIRMEAITFCPDVEEMEMMMRDLNEGSCYDPDEIRDADYYKRFGLD